VRPRRVDVEEEPFEEGALAGGDLDQPADEEAPGAEVRVRYGPRALEDEAANELGVAERQLLGDDAAAREASDVGGGHVEPTKDAGAVAISSTETRAPGMAVRPAPRLSKAVRR
jgi:hypothetical protein